MIATLVATNRRLALFPESLPAPESPIVALFRSSAAERGLKLGDGLPRLSYRQLRPPPHPTAPLAPQSGCRLLLPGR